MKTKSLLYTAAVLSAFLLTSVGMADDLGSPRANASQIKVVKSEAATASSMNHDCCKEVAIGSPRGLSQVTILGKASSNDPDFVRQNASTLPPRLAQQLGEKAVEFRVAPAK